MLHPRQPGFSGYTTSVSFCTRFVQSSKRRKCSASCSTICSSSACVKRAISQVGIRIRGARNPITLGRSSISVVQIVTRPPRTFLSAAASVALNLIGRAVFHNRRSRIECAVRAAPRIAEQTTQSPAIAKPHRGSNCSRGAPALPASATVGALLVPICTNDISGNPAATPNPAARTMNRCAAEIRGIPIRQISSPHTITAPCQIEVTSVVPAVRAKASPADANHAKTAGAAN